jgi:hypothetical protein
MARTRRSISIKGLSYQRLKDHCDAQGKSISGYVEELLEEKLDDANVPIPTEITPPRKKKKPDADPDQIAGQHFTF